MNLTVREYLAQYRQAQYRLAGRGAAPGAEAENAEASGEVADTRWPSTFSMLKRYFQMIEFISADDEDLAAFLPSRVSHCKLEALFASLRDVESVTKRIQANDPTLLDALTSAEEAVFVSFLGVRATMPDPASMCAEGFAE
ncbi:hypothetical protein PF005_g30060 [Phytophthora fragariae]|nr:hypothetical protein PF011_g29857 [Phytophthora fragariae]KAE9164384.1 hypothetical protein PF005_g30060 [Phytophthora fragariae]